MNRKHNLWASIFSLFAFALVSFGAHAGIGGLDELPRNDRPKSFDLASVMTGEGNGLRLLYESMEDVQKPSLGGRAMHEYYETEISGLYHEIIELGLILQFPGVAGGDMVRAELGWRFDLITDDKFLTGDSLDDDHGFYAAFGYTRWFTNRLALGVRAAYNGVGDASGVEWAVNAEYHLFGTLSVTGSTERREEPFVIAEDRINTVGLRLRW